MMMKPSLSAFALLLSVAWAALGSDIVRNPCDDGVVSSSSDELCALQPGIGGVGSAQEGAIASPQPVASPPVSSPPGSSPPGLPPPAAKPVAPAPVDGSRGSPSGEIGSAASDEPVSASPPLLVDATVHPTVRISWPTRQGGTTTLSAPRAYLSAEERTPLGKNLESFAAVGGTRVDLAAADPRGHVVRAGFYKADKTKLLFEDMAPGGAVTIEMEGIRMTGAAECITESGVFHAKWDNPLGVLGCLPAPDQLNLYHTASVSDDLNGRINEKNGRLGVLGVSGSSPITSQVRGDGTLSIRAVIPYELFKHVTDPWMRSNPGDFSEPFHFHVEFQVMPRGVKPNPPNPAYRLSPPGRPATDPNAD